MPLKKPKYADLGFGNGAFIKRIANPAKRIVHGIEHPNARKLKRNIPGAKLKYIGFEKWLQTTPDNYYHGINASNFFNNIIEKLKKYYDYNPSQNEAYSGRNFSGKKMSFEDFYKLVNEPQTNAIRKAEAAFIKIIERIKAERKVEAAFIKIIERIKNKLIPGGYLRITNPPHNALIYFEKAGFEITTDRHLEKKDLITRWDKIHFSRHDWQNMTTSPPVFAIARKPPDNKSKAYMLTPTQ